MGSCMLVSRLGTLKFTWFVTLKNSNRNSSCCFSLILKRLLTAASILKKAGPNSESEPTSPNVPNAFGTKALGLSHCWVLRFLT